MADIKQAAIWLQEGKHVTDPEGFSVHARENSEVVVHDDDLSEFILWVPDMLSDDWELAESTEKEAPHDLPAENQERTP